jgi:hypothetical protein
MAYLDTTHVNPSVRAARHPLLALLLAPHPATAGRPTLERALKSHLHDVQLMLLAAILAAATIVAVAAALLLHS